MKISSCVWQTGLCAALLLTGCLTPDPSVRVADPEDRSGYYEQAMTRSGGYSFRTMNFLRANLFLEMLQESPRELLRTLEGIQRSWTGDMPEIMSDICFNVAEHLPDEDEAVSFYLSAAMYAYDELFGAPSAEQKNEKFDPSRCQLLVRYNASVAQIFEYIRRNGLLKRDSYELKNATGVRLRFGKTVTELPYGDDYEDLLPCSTFQVYDMQLINQRFGVGVPMIALARPENRGKLVRMSPSLPMPATLVLKLDRKKNSDSVDAVFHLYDTFVKEEIKLAGDTVPLALDYSTPLASFDHYNVFMTKNLIQYMLDPASGTRTTGLYLLEPYNPDKIPVVFVHGLMSAPVTWVKMLNVLRHYPRLRSKYQFWFFKYSSGNPVLASAATLRDALNEAEKTFAVTPEARATFNRMVLVGHSMGGLISRVVTQDDPEYFVESYTGEPWETFSKQLSPEEIAGFEKIFFKKPPCISRLVMMAVPHRGSSMAKWSVARIGSNLIRIPGDVLKQSALIFKTLLRIREKDSSGDYWRAMVFTGIDNLDPDNRFITILSGSPFASDIPRHSVIGNNERDGVPGGTDGVVPYTSSHVDGVESEWIVKSGHSVHQSPAAIRILARILHQHLEENGKNVKVKK